MAAALHHALLAAACGALLAAAHRLAARLTDRPGERATAAFVLATAAGVLSALALGLVGLGSRPAALGAAAGLLLAGALAFLPAPAPTSRSLLRSAWSRLGRPGRAGAGALAALALLLVAWPLHRPILGLDGAVYHLPEIAAWVANGRPGSDVAVSHLFPFSRYPILNEVALTWAAGIARSLVPVVLWPQVLYVMTAMAGAQALAGLGAGRAPAALAVAAVLATPVVVEQLATPSTDLAGLCWVACAAAMAAGARERPGLAAPALVAAGLALGTKTTTVPLVACILAFLAWRLRGAEGSSRAAVAGGALVAAVLFVPWPLRNLLDHGSPLWPFRTLPGGDPVPSVWRQIEPSLLERPRATLAGRTGAYAGLLAGALVLAAAAPLAWLACRTRTVVAASAVAMGALAAWAAAPSTGAPDTAVFAANPLSATRYAMPAFGAAAAALALAAGSRTRLAPATTAALCLAVAWSALQSAQREAPFLPPAWAVVLAAVAGAAGASLVPGVRAALGPHTRGRAIAAAAVGCVLAGVVLGRAAGGLVARQAVAVPTLPGTAAASWARAQPGFADGQVIAFTGTVFGQLAGERLQHRLELVPADEPCAAVRARARRGLVVAADEGVTSQLGVATATRCLAGLRPAFVAGDVAIYGALR